jgi:hypothetical protein
MLLDFLYIKNVTVKFWWRKSSSSYYRLKKYFEVRSFLKIRTDRCTAKTFKHKWPSKVWLKKWWASDSINLFKTYVLFILSRDVSNEQAFMKLSKFSISNWVLKHIVMTSCSLKNFWNFHRLYPMYVSLISKSSAEFWFFFGWIFFVCKTKRK